MNKKVLKSVVLILVLALCATLFFYNGSSKEEVKPALNTQIEKKITETAKPKPVSISADKEKKEAVQLRYSNPKKAVAKAAYSQKVLDSVAKLRERYAAILENHPMRKAMNLTKKERKKIGLPPNAYNDQDWLYSMNPVLGRPQPEALFTLYDELTDMRKTLKSPGEDADNPWEERGPNNVGGRTRALLFAPGSTTKVFAGGVSGGLWVNNDITSAATQWQRVSGVPSNLSITCITVDPNNSQIMYLGTGEVYTWGSVNGNGVYKSTDGGNNWARIFGTPGANVNNNIIYIQDIIAWNNPTTNQTEVFFGADAMNYSEQVVAGPGWAWLGLNTIGLYRSTDGTNFARMTGAPFVDGGGRFYAPNSFDTDFNGNLFMGTKYNYTYGTTGGMLFRTSNGGAWTNVRDFGTGGRVEVACSKTTAGKMYVLLEDQIDAAGPVKIKRSTDGFATVNTNIAIPTSIGRQPPAANDFTRGQNFYDLMIGVDPTNDANVYVGGIEIFKTTNSGTAWAQLTDWTGVNGALDGVHSDQHCMAFSSTSRMVFGNDGGVYYSNDSGTTISERNNGYNVVQFYMASINQTGATQKLMGGAQDNGTQFINNAAAGISGAAEINGGDGCWNFTDTGDQYMISSYVYNVYSRHNINGGWVYDIASNQADGDFVNQCGLDSTNDILYANGSSGGTYRIYRYTLGAASTTATATLTNALLNQVPTFFRVNPFTPTTLLVGTATGRLLRITGANGGAPAWASIGDATWAGAISDVRFGATANDIFVTFHNYGVTSVWYSANGGTSWQNKEGDLPNMPVKCILQNPANTSEVIVGTELGVWRTSNFGVASPNWVQSYNGMSDVKVMSFDYRAVDKTILAATFGRGMFTGSFWTCGDTTTTWNGAAWSNGVPTKKTAVTIDGNYDTAVNGSFEACSLTVNGGRTLTISANNYVQISSDVTVNATGTLDVLNQGSLVMVNDTGVVTNNGTMRVHKTTSSFERYDYIYWSSPITNAVIGTVFTGWDLTHAYQFIPANFSDLTGPGGTGPADGFDDNSNDWSAVASGTVMTPGKGYIVMTPTSGVFPRTTSVVFTGSVNNGVVTQPVALSGNAAATNDDWNLLGNPYPSAIDADDFISANTNISGTIYLWSHVDDVSVSNPGPNVSNFNANDYAMYNLSGGTKSVSNSALPNGYIASGQGFIVEAASAGNVTFRNSMRNKAHPNTQFFRNGDENQNSRNRFWLSLRNSDGMYSQQLIGYFPEATNMVDNGYDGVKPVTQNYVSFYSLLGDAKYGIQGKGEFLEDDVVAVGYFSAVAGSFTIEIDQAEGLFSTHDIFIRDLQTGIVHNLKNGSYAFTTQAGTFDNRFEIVYVPSNLNTDNFVNENEVVVFASQNQINFKSSKASLMEITVFDISGRKLYDNSNVNKNEFAVTSVVANKQPLVVKIKLDNGQRLTKKIIY
jgi:hypothetical protein